MQHVRVYLGLFLLLLTVIFTVQNAEVVTVNFLFWHFAVSRALMIFFVLIAGVIVGLVVSELARRRH